MSVSALATDTGLSRTPVRETLLQLERERFLSLEQHRGFFVRELTEEEARELYPILHALEDLALTSGGRLSRATLAALAALNRSLVDSSDPDTAVSLNFSWHATLTQQCRNEELLRLVRHYRMRVYRYERTYYQPGVERVAYSAKLHAKIIDALRAGDLEAARRVLETHWVGDYTLYLPGAYGDAVNGGEGVPTGAPRNS